MISQYLKSNKAKFLLSVVVFSVIIFLGSEFLVADANLEVSGDCKKIKTGNLSCLFECNFTAKCQNNFTGRIIALHSGWASIFDKKTKMRCDRENTMRAWLPKRNYTYTLRGAFYDKEKYGVLKKMLRC